MSIKATAQISAACCALLLAACSAIPPSAGGPAPEDEREARALRTGSVSSLTREDLQHQSVTRVEELLEGRVAGVHVVRLPNGDFSLRIRGVSSLNASTEPLVVIDGMPVGPFHVSGALAALNPRDVERIDVLKDAGETAFYGMRGANGVIVIRTRRGR